MGLIILVPQSTHRIDSIAKQVSDAHRFHVLWPLLTSVPSRRASRLAAPSRARVLGAQISLSQDVNSGCATGPFISGTEQEALLCGASLPVPSTFYWSFCSSAHQL